MNVRVSATAVALLAAVLVALTIAGCGGTPSTQAPPATPAIVASEGGSASASTTAGSSGSASGSRSVATAVPASPAAQAPSAPVQLGSQLFQTGNGDVPIGRPCATCHGADAQGAIGPDIRWSVVTGVKTSARAPRFKLKTAADLMSVTNNGQAPGGALRPMMPHYRLTDAEVSAILAYLKSL